MPADLKTDAQARRPFPGLPGNTARESAHDQDDDPGDALAQRADDEADEESTDDMANEVADEVADEPVDDSLNDLAIESADDPATDLRVELRVLYGPQAGSRLMLAEGEYLLGSSDMCTIILAGPKIEQEHAILTLEGGQISIQPLDGDVNDALGNELSDTLVLEPGQAVELGGIWIAVDDPDADWPDLHTIAPAPGRAQAEAVDTVEEGTGEEDSDGAMLVVSDTAAVPVAVHGVGGETVIDAAVEDVADGAMGVGRRWLVRLKTIPPRLIIAAATLGLALLAVAIWIAVGNDDERRSAVIAAVTRPVLRQPRPVPPPAITSYLASLPYGKGLSVARDDAGDWSVSGAVPTGLDRKQMTEALANLQPPAVAHVSVVEDMVAAANRYLAGRSASGSNAVLRVELGEAGSVRLVGAASDMPVVDAVIRELRENVPGLLRVDAQVLLPQQLRERLRARIAEAGLDKRLSYVQEAPEVVLGGRLNSDETARWEMLLVQFAREYGNVVPIRASIGNGNPAVVTASVETERGGQRLPVGVQAIVSGPVPYIVTSSGKRINQGGEIDGQTLLSVRDGEVVFEGKRRIRIMR